MAECFIDHKITSIQDFIDYKTLEEYEAQDINVYQSNIFHTKMKVKNINLQDYLFQNEVDALSPEEQEKIRTELAHEMAEIYSGKNIYRK